ncbi:hypothetical protein [Profundibacter sp.]
MKAILFFIANGVAFACGSNLLSTGWIFATLVIDYIRAVFSESENAPEGNFRNLSSTEFGQSENNIKMTTFKNLVVSAVFFGFGFACNALGWI